MEVVDDNGNITTNIDEVVLRWKNDYENLLGDNTDNGFDENHLRNVKIKTIWYNKKMSIYLR